MEGCGVNSGFLNYSVEACANAILLHSRMNWLHESVKRSLSCGTTRAWK
jgi:hypothetical protein